MLRGFCYSISLPLSVTLKAELEKLNFDTQLADRINSDMRKVKSEMFQLNDRIQALYTKFPQLHFEYTKPEPNFDETRVKGLVCNLFKVKDQKYATALEIAGGGKVRIRLDNVDQSHLKTEFIFNTLFSLAF